MNKPQEGEDKRIKCQGCDGGREDEACYLQKECSDNSGVSMRHPYKEENMRQGGASHGVEVFEVLLQY